MSDEQWEQELRWHHYSSAMEIAAKLPQNTDAALTVLNLARALVLDVKRFRDDGEVRVGEVSFH